jgi:thioredoxin reductase
MLDCVIIGGGPAGLNAALVLGRARRNVVLFDNNSPRNVVTQESHGFITRDGVSPSEFRNCSSRHSQISFCKDKK